MPLGAFRSGFFGSVSAGGAASGPTVYERPLTITPIGNAQVDTAQSKIGGASLLPSGGYLSVDMNVPTGDFTIECWARITNRSAPSGLWEIRDENNPDHRIALYGGEAGGGYKVLYLTYRDSSGTEQIDIVTPSNTFPDTTWKHCAVTRSGNTFTVWIDGTNRGSATYNDFAMPDSTVFYAGGAATSGRYFRGNVDEFRVSGNARYTSNFSAPSSAFGDDADTLLLMHMDGADGSTTFTDDALPAYGGTVSTVNIGGTDYKVHAFTTNDTFTPLSDITADVLIVGGGGPGGQHISGTIRANDELGGGGAGQIIWQTGLTLTPDSYSINVATSTNPGSNTGDSSSAFGYTAVGGGRGGNINTSSSVVNGYAGGNASGGGGSWTDYYSKAGTGGSGVYSGSTAFNSIAGGGGGANGNASSRSGGSSANYSTYFGTSYGQNGYFGRGGDGGQNSPSNTVNNTGDGGEGGYAYASSKPGASGIVLIRYPV
jgi:hypothetical protein